MNSERYLPAIVLPNRDNAQDSFAVVRSGERLTMSELLQKIGPTTSLRFMVDSSQPMPPQKPRLTWQRMDNNQVIISAAFECGEDTYSRMTSAAVVFLQSKPSDITKALEETLPGDLGTTVANAVLSKAKDVAEFIDHQIAAGISGGEIGEVKKNSRGFPLLSEWG